MIGSLLTHDQRSVQGDQICLLEKLFLGNIGQQSFINKFLVGESVPADNGHAEALADLREDLADTAGTYDTRYLVMQVDTQQSVQGEVVVFDLLIGFVDTAVGCLTF